MAPFSIREAGDGDPGSLRTMPSEMNQRHPRYSQADETAARAPKVRGCGTDFLVAVVVPKKRALGTG